MFSRLMVAAGVGEDDDGETEGKLGKLKGGWEVAPAPGEGGRIRERP